MQEFWFCLCISLITVDILTMHNTDPQLFLCIVTLYARSDVSHFQHDINIYGREINTKKELRVVYLTEFA